MDDAERSFDATGDWFVLAHGEQALMMVTRMSENLRRAVRLKLVYVDDADRHAPPEVVAGSALRGDIGLKRGFRLGVHASPVVNGIIVLQILELLFGGLQRIFGFKPVLFQTRLLAQL